MTKIYFRVFTDNLDTYLFNQDRTINSIKMTKSKFRPLVVSTITLLLALIMFKCGKKDSPFLTVNTNSIQVPNAKSTESIVISASGNWSVSVDQSWIKLSKLSGTGNGDFAIEIDLNPTTSSRSANITIQANDVPAPQIVAVNQTVGDPILKVSRIQATFAAPEAGVDTLRIISNTSWTVSDNQAWLTVTPSSGNGNATIVLNAEINAGLSKREATLTITASGSNLTKTVSIFQYPRVSIVAGGNGIGSNLNQLHLPSSVCVDNQGNTFITDQFNNRVVKWVPNSLQGTIVAGGNGSGNGLNQLNSPYGIFVHTNGELYIGDNQNHRVVKWTTGVASGILVAGGNGFGSNLNQTSSPDGVYVDSKSNLYVSEAGNHRVTKWITGANTGILIAEGAPIAFTTALTLDGDGNVYIASGNNSNVTKWAPGSTQGVVIAGGNGRGANLNQLNSPSGVYVDNNGTIFISDQSNDRVVKWLSGATSGIVVAGGNGKGSNLDQLNSPSGLWVDTNGNIYISDQGNNRIAKWLK